MSNSTYELESILDFLVKQQKSNHQNYHSQNTYLCNCQTYDSIRHKLNKFIDDHQKIQKKTKTANDSLEFYKQEIKNIDVQNQNSKLELDEERRSNKKMIQDYNSLVVKFNSSNQQVEKLNFDYNQLVKKYNSKVREEESQKAINQTSTDNYNMLVQKYNNLARESELQNQQFQRKKNQLIDENNRLVQQYNKLVRETQFQQQKRSTIRQTGSSNRAQVEYLEKEVKRLERYIEDLTRKNSNQLKERTKINSQVYQLQDKISKLEQDLTASKIQSSSSSRLWKSQLKGNSDNFEEDIRETPKFNFDNAKEVRSKTYQNQGNDTNFKKYRFTIQ